MKSIPACLVACSLLWGNAVFAQEDLSQEDVAQEINDTEQLKQDIAAARQELQAQRDKVRDDAQASPETLPAEPGR